MLKISLLLSNLQTLAVNISNILRIRNAKIGEYCFHMNTNIQGDFQIQICVPLESILIIIIMCAVYLQILKKFLIPQITKFYYKAFTIIVFEAQLIIFISVSSSELMSIKCGVPEVSRLGPLVLLSSTINFYIRFFFKIDVRQMWSTSRIYIRTTFFTLNQ